MGDVLTAPCCRWPLPWWRHQMETFSALLALYAGNSSVTGEFPTQRPVTRSFDVLFICASIHDWVNNREAGDLRRHRANNDGIVMWYKYIDSIWAYIPMISYLIKCEKILRNVLSVYEVLHKRCNQMCSINAWVYILCADVPMTLIYEKFHKRCISHQSLKLGLIW